MAKCERCSAEIVPGAKYCISCGARVGGTYEEFYINSENLTNKVRQLIHEGNVSRIIVKDEHDTVLLDMPVTVGVVGAILAPWLAALGVIAALVTNCKLVVERR
ncbi:MAG: DUF4342 domain-containing protein [Nitrososphaerota archaeon]|nr:DUF4342 domain-containing protein [Nitrososphaerota archaeon]